MRRLASACAGASASYFVASKASAVQREAGAESVVHSFAEAAPLVDESGVAVVCACVPAALLERCKQTEAFRSLPARAGAGHAAEWRQSAYGRFHRVDFADDDVHAFEELELAFAPLVERFFRDGERGSRVYRSELQLLTATPTHCDAVNREQTWHADNQARGLTIIVPLVDFCAENGATQLLPGTHALRSAWPAVLRGGAITIAPRCGDIAVYDCRTYHRGLGNSTAAGRPALVFRYDCEATPPPGVGLLGSVAHTSLARALHVASSCGLAMREAVT